MHSDFFHVRRASGADADAVTDVLATAFLPDPVSRWIFPDDLDRARSHPAFFRVFVNLALAEGHIDTIGDIDGVALWLPVNQDQRSDDEDLGAVFDAAIGAEHTRRFGVLDRLMTDNHPHDRAHAYLPFVAVRPGRQSFGLGAALLGHRLAELDAAGEPAYLEASCPRSQRLYERLGFKAMPVSLDLPEGPSLQPMWREPR